MEITKPFSKIVTVEELARMTANRFDELETDTKCWIGELRSEMNDRFTDMENRFDKRFNGIDARFDGIDKRFDSLENRFDKMEKRFDKFEALLKKR